jgi:hypothetical protein
VCQRRATSRRVGGGALQGPEGRGIPGGREPHAPGPGSAGPDDARGPIREGDELARRELRRPGRRGWSLRERASSLGLGMGSCVTAGLHGAGPRRSGDGQRRAGGVDREARWLGLPVYLRGGGAGTACIRYRLPCCVRPPSPCCWWEPRPRWPSPDGGRGAPSPRPAPGGRTPIAASSVRASGAIGGHAGKPGRCSAPGASPEAGRPERERATPRPSAGSGVPGGDVMLITVPGA